MHWLARTSFVRERSIIPIDLRRDDWVVAYNLLREREQVAASVVTDNLVDALAYVWGAGGTDATPRLARNMATVFQVLYEHKLTLVEALRVLDFANHEFRATLARGTKDEATRQVKIKILTPALDNRAIIEDPSQGRPRYPLGSCLINQRRTKMNRVAHPLVIDPLAFLLQVFQDTGNPIAATRALMQCPL